MELIGSVHGKADTPGDFGWMIRQPEYADALFIFNDNAEQCLAHLEHPGSPTACQPGRGNAAIRPYQCETPPRAAGIPTGSRGVGYAHLTPSAKALIDRALDAIRTLVCTTYPGRYRRLIYSADKHHPDTLGTGIFAVGDEVKSYIMAGLRVVAASAATASSDRS